jgi:L,D-peptidoglycan transpeptidase YkuD (ErfK/YbiS/YcfS/YnhG family)
MTGFRVTGDGWLATLGLRFPCALGRAGIVTTKREGDAGTPAGRWPLREVLFRPDRVVPPVTHLPVSAITRGDGWCDDPAHPDYNRRVRLPHPASCEDLWRDDALYDLIGVVGYNDSPVVPGRGSAIFLHVAAPGYAPTAGCVALAPVDLRAVLAEASTRNYLVIEPPFSI